MPNPEEIETSVSLLRQMQGPGNEAAWHTFVERYQPMIERWCRRAGLRHDQVEEVTSRVLYRLVRAMGMFRYDRGKGRFRDWLRIVVKRQVRDYWRSLRRKPDQQGRGDWAFHQWLEEVPDPASLDELAEELSDQMHRDMERLAQAQAQVQAQVEPHRWEAFWRTVGLGQSTPEVAAALGLSESTVSQAKYYVRKMLRRALEQQDLVVPS